MLQRMKTISTDQIRAQVGPLVGTYAAQALASRKFELEGTVVLPSVKLHDSMAA